MVEGKEDFLSFWEKPREKWNGAPSPPLSLSVDSSVTSIIAPLGLSAAAADADAY